MFVKIPLCELCNNLNHNKIFCKTNIPVSEPVTDINQIVVTSLAMNSGTFSETNDKGVYLQTCTVFVFDNSNTRGQLARILIDDWSQRSFIRSDLAQKLNLKTLRERKIISFFLWLLSG